MKEISVNLGGNCYLKIAGGGKNRDYEGKVGENRDYEGKVGGK